MATVRPNQRQSNQGELSRLSGAILRGLAVGVLTLIALWLILAAFALADSDPMRLTTPLSLTALFSGAIASGFAAGRYDRADAVLAGFLAGAAYVLLLWLISLFFRGGSEGISPLMLALGYAGCLAASPIGGLLAKERMVGGTKNAPAAARRRIKAKRR